MDTKWRVFMKYLFKWVNAIITINSVSLGNGSHFHKNAAVVVPLNSRHVNIWSSAHRLPTTTQHPFDCKSEQKRYIIKEDEINVKMKSSSNDHNKKIECLEQNLPDSSYKPRTNLRGFAVFKGWALSPCDLFS